MKNLLYAIGMILVGALLLAIILPIEIIEEIRDRKI